MPSKKRAPMPPVIPTLKLNTGTQPDSVPEQVVGSEFDEVVTEYRAHGNGIQAAFGVLLSDYSSTTAIAPIPLISHGDKQGRMRKLAIERAREAAVSEHGEHVEIDWLYITEIVSHAATHVIVELVDRRKP